MLTGLHRFASAALYQLCLAEADERVGRLAALSETLEDWRGTTESAEVAGARLAERLDAIGSWCFEQPPGPARDWLRECR
jgi:hypothetical protein